MQAKKFLTVTISGAAALALALTLSIFSSQSEVKAEEAKAKSSIGPVCVFGWSKDTCSGELMGNVSKTECRRTIDGEHTTCGTYYLRNAEFKIPIKQGVGTCGTMFFERCDQTPQLDGTLLIYGDFVFGTDNCPYRGGWSGEWRLIDNNGAYVANGTGSGTLGTGSQRAIGPCIGPDFGCSVDCKDCYDVNFDGNRWHVGFEGALYGTVFDGEWTSSTISITLSGNLSTPGDAGGPNDFGKWFFCGASDGVVMARCDS